MPNPSDLRVGIVHGQVYLASGDPDTILWIERQFPEGTWFDDDDGAAVYCPKGVRQARIAEPLEESDEGANDVFAAAICGVRLSD
jgi:hypothetical protein